ncbi:hypothetical protein B0H16DRAFT_1457293 [Mycena metata]|uniref:Uncharacterized protein n=1 Tax=Mycena metata TaxID=1033252 RepID=A0AAD7NFN6_9AGAR|nr:hypothetical protein B0H16DRAFT_1457293 [Mycena metata]
MHMTKSFSDKSPNSAKIEKEFTPAITEFRHFRRAFSTAETQNFSRSFNLVETQSFGLNFTSLESKSKLCISSELKFGPRTVRRQSTAWLATIRCPSPPQHPTIRAQTVCGPSFCSSSHFYRALGTLGAATVGREAEAVLLPGCGKRHREYYDFVRAGGFAGMERIIRYWLRKMGETDYVEQKKARRLYIHHVVLYIKEACPYLKNNLGRSKVQKLLSPPPAGPSSQQLRPATKAQPTNCLDADGRTPGRGWAADGQKLSRGLSSDGLRTKFQLARNAKFRL